MWRYGGLLFVFHFVFLFLLFEQQRRSSFLLPYVILSVISIGFFMIILIIVVLVVMYVIATETTRLAEVWSFYFILITMAVLLPTIGKQIRVRYILSQF